MRPKSASNGQRVTPRQALFVAGLALGKSRAEAARFASVSERTGRRPGAGSEPAALRVEASVEEVDAMGRECRQPP